MNRLIIFFLLFSILFASCSEVADSDEETGKAKPLARELTSHEEKLVEADQSFSYEIFHQVLKQDSSQNVFISPLSISIALGMTLNGAAGETMSGMKEALSLQGMGMENINKSYASLIKLLREADSRVNMKVANSIWIKDGLQMEEKFREDCRNFFEAQIELLDFSEPSAPDKINKWVEDNTEGLIDSIIEGRIPDEIIMYLINAIYFKGDWRYKFDAEKTEPQPFSLADGSAKKTDMMLQENQFSAYVSDEVKMLDLPYGDSLFTMTLLMPADDSISLNNFIQNRVTADNMNRWYEDLSIAKTKIIVPKFKMEYNIGLNQILQAMGMEQAFSQSKADFTNINKEGRLFISKAKHKSFVTVDEEGTETAAVTSVGVGVTSLPQIRMLVFNQPFVFLIREQTSGTILFMGAMKNPSK